MKRFILILLYAFTLPVLGQAVWREATTAEIAAGTVGAPATVTPRRLAGAFSASTNDATLSLQSAMKPNAFIKLAPGDYYITNTITLTNGVYLSGYGATLHFATNITGFAIYEPTNVWGCILDGIAIDGGYSNVIWNARGTGVTNLQAGILPNIIANAPFIDHSGIFINAGGGGLVRATTVYNFPGYSYFMTDTNDNVSYVLQQTVYEDNCAHNNYLGPWPQAWSFDNGRGTLSPAYQADAEYIVLEGWNCFSNTLGMVASAGSAMIEKNSLNKNYIGLMLQSASNGGKGIVSGNTINHNLYAGIVIDGNTSSGGIISGNEVLANPLEIFWGNAGLEIYNNKFSNDTVLFSNSISGGPNNFHDNSYQGVFGTDFIIKGLITFTNQAWGNRSSTVPGDSDSQPYPPINGLNLTNIAAQPDRTFPTNTIYAATNTAPLARVNNPLSNGSTYTTPNAQGFITGSITLTNQGWGYISNVTTLYAIRIGPVTASTGTNDWPFVLRTAPGDVVVWTNGSANAGSPRTSEWRP